MSPILLSTRAAIMTIVLIQILSEKPILSQNIIFGPTLLQQLEDAERKLDNCLSGLGISYNQPCDDGDIAVAVTKFKAIKKAGKKVTLNDEENLARVQCRTFPFISKCEKSSCKCALYSDSDCQSIEYTPRADSCEGPYQQVQLKKHLYLRFKNAMKPMKSQSAAHTPLEWSLFGVFIILFSVFLLTD